MTPEARPAGSRRTGVAAGATGMLAVGLAVQRYAIGRIRRRPAGPTRPPRHTADRTGVVWTGDGTPLHVEEDGPADAPLTVVFVHGFCLTLDSWCLQRARLAGAGGPPVRRVFYDQRGHGRSGRASSRPASLQRLGEDLYELVCQVAPGGRVVLVGHSMGGMVVTTLAAGHPELFGRPAGGTAVVGVALLSSSTGRLAEVTLGLPAPLTRVRGSLTAVLVRGVRWRASLVERGRRAGGDLTFLLTRRYAFASASVDPWLVEHVSAMIAGTPVEVIADLLPVLTAHDGRAGLGALAHVPVLVLVGDGDRLTPPGHSAAIAERLPHARFAVLPGAGHLLILERPELVDHHLRALLHRAAGCAQAGVEQG